MYGITVHSYQLCASFFVYLNLFCCLGRTTVARSPQENDRSELLRDAEPIGYATSVSDDPFRQDELDDVASGYQSARPSRPNTLFDSNSRKPRGIFDDI